MQNISYEKYPLCLNNRKISILLKESGPICYKLRKKYLVKGKAPSCA
jgi:hypothetical protein